MQSVPPEAVIVDAIPAKGTARVAIAVREEAVRNTAIENKGAMINLRNENIIDHQPNQFE